MSKRYGDYEQVNGAVANELIVQVERLKDIVNDLSTIDIARLRVGDQVRYRPERFKDNEWQNGVVKEIRDGITDGAWVVYNCDGNWDNYIDYRGTLTNLHDLKLGWIL